MPKDTLPRTHRATLKPRTSVKLFTAWLLHQQTSMKMIMSRRFHHSSQWSSRVTHRLLVVDTSARPRPRNLQRESILRRSMLSKRLSIQWTSRQSSHRQPQTKLVWSFKFIMLWPMPQSVEWDHTVALEFPTDQSRSTRRSRSSLAQIKRAVLKRARKASWPKELQAHRRWRFQRVTSLNFKVMDQTWDKTWTTTITKKDSLSKEKAEHNRARTAKSKETLPASHKVRQRSILISTQAMSVESLKLISTAKVKQLLLSKANMVTTIRDQCWALRMQHKLSRERLTSITRLLISESTSRKTKDQIKQAWRSL